MFKKFKIFNYRVMIYARRVYGTAGINSNLKDGLHVPMFDLDKINIRELETEALRIGELYRLGDAVILSTGRQDSYHLYFMNRLPFRKCLEIGVTCAAVDLKHIQFSIKRGHFTLRSMPKKGRTPYLVSIIRSKNPSDFSPKDFTSFVLYETANAPC